MAYSNFSAALPASAHPLAKPGYGKRSVPGQHPRGENDFAHLRSREATLGAYVDRLPEGTSIGYKALAAALPEYGQQACGKALNFLSDAGHLRRIKEHLQLEDNTFRWVTWTFWSRTAKDDDWWRVFVASMRGVDLTARERRARAACEVAPTTSAESAPEEWGPEPVWDEAPEWDADAEPRTDSEPGAEPAPATGPEPLAAVPVAAPAAVPAQVAAPAAVPAQVAAPAAAPAHAAAPSDAYRVLQRLGRTEPRMTLSAAECAALESLAAQWLARGATPEHLTRSLTTGLPHPLHSPVAIARVRLESKVPPAPVEEQAHVTRAFMVCVTCEVPENVRTLIRGVCLDCREDMEAYDVAEESGEVIEPVPDTFRGVPAQVDVARRADEARVAAGFKARPVTRPAHGDLTHAPRARAMS